MAKHKEGRIETYFCEQVEEAGGLTRKVQWIGRRGCPDRLWSFKRNRPCYGFAEIKAPGCPLDPHQEREIKRLRDKGVEVVVLSTTEDVDYFIRSHRP